MIPIKEDLVQRLRELYVKLRDEGRVRTTSYDGERFPYVLFDRDEIPQETPFIRFAFLAGSISKNDRIGIRLERDMPGPNTTYRRVIQNLDSLIFVCREQGPEEFQDIWAIHEYVEEYTESHSRATKEHFLEAKRRGNKFLDRFARFYAKSFKDIEVNENALRSVIPTEVVPIFIEEGYLPPHLS